MINTHNAKWISAKLQIFAGLCLWEKPTVENMSINVEELREGEVCYGKLNIIKEMTLSEISKELGYNVKIVKEQSHDTKTRS